MVQLGKLNNQNFSLELSQKNTEPFTLCVKTPLVSTPNFFQKWYIFRGGAGQIFTQRFSNYRKPFFSRHIQFMAGHVYSLSRSIPFLNFVPPSKRESFILSTFVFFLVHLALSLLWNMFLNQHFPNFKLEVGYVPSNRKKIFCSITCLPPKLLKVSSKSKILYGEGDCSVGRPGR